MCIADAILDYAAAHSNGSFVMNDASNDPGLAGIFSTYPSAWLSIPGGIGDQVIFSLTRQLFFFLKRLINDIERIQFKYADIWYFSSPAGNLCHYRSEE